MIKYTHLVRIYRASIDRAHDLSIVLREDDIYGEDKWARLMPDEDSISIPNEFGVIVGSARLFVPVDIDVSVGYFIFVKKPRVLDGQREAVDALLTLGADIDATELSVDNLVGFTDGDIVTITDGVDYQQVKLSGIQSTSLSIYDEYALKHYFAVGSSVTAGTYYRVVGRHIPHDLAPIQTLSVEEVLGIIGD